MNVRYLRSGFSFALAHAVEEAGEFLAAAGKTLRWGKDSVNPELPEAEQETNVDWLTREMSDLRCALDRLSVAIAGNEPAANTTPWSTDVELLDDHKVRINILLSTDKGPARGFRPYLDVDLDEAHATELLGKLALALDRRRREAKP